ncbi:Rho GTPase activation protein [Sparassis crispa]|uniref:Rho GTPase activation protein n=1 Tax=Sparassis crispa TaxID=139825 RepID=A0A401G702_9APHY|nr:Rho GTPase activation protein [Sparassis crispa]GBE77946.1 Rho GTPase activation protein [Sparassis crispa]
MSTREFYVSVELYLSSKTASTLRKPTVKKSNDKREVTKAVSGSNVVKEKSSWLGLGRQSSVAGQWRPVTCKLVDEEDACTLNIYIDETILYKSVYVYLLNHTDIRPIHRSLFDRADCIGIFCVTGQVSSTASSAEPVYLQFPDTDAMKVWVTLLRSFAMPEVYGRWLSPEDGGLYRMWRQIELTCLQGRNLGTSRLLPGDPANAESDSKLEADAIDIDVYCEIFVNGCLAGRTTVKKGVGSPDWQERFIIADLPLFENLEIVVWREKKMMKPTIVGSVVIVLGNFRRGEHVEGWFPVLSGGPTTRIQAGEIRLRLRIDEEIILPYASYSAMLETFNARNSLDWLSDFESKLNLKNVSNHIISISIAQNVLIENIMELADREVDGTLSSHNTLFRGNTVLTKTMESFMSWYGASFLEASIGPAVRRICGEKITIEVDPARGGKGMRGVEKSVDVLVYWCQEFWAGIYDARRQCPHELRRLFEHIRRLVEKRYRVADDKNRDLPWQSVSAFCFLRFMVPAILHPHLFGLWPGLPEAKVQRSLTLVAKVIQNLANLNATVQKEAFMRGVKDFLTGSLQAMVDYIVVVSTPEPGDNRSTSYALDGHERLRIMNALRQRGAAVPVLYREAIPLLPHLLDIPKHLAAVTSQVVRYTKVHSVGAAMASNTEDGCFDEFRSKCVAVEEQALHRVSQMATEARHQSSGQHDDRILTQRSVIVSTSSGHDQESKASLPSNKSQRWKPTRPSTASSMANNVDISDSLGVSGPQSPSAGPEGSTI